MQRLARTRPFPVRKKFLYDAQTQLLTQSPLVLILQPTDLTANEWTSLRSSISQIRPPTDTASKPKLTFLRAGLLTAIERDNESVKLPLLAVSKGKGSLAALTSPTDPATLKALLRLLDKASKTAGPNTPPQDPKKPKVEIRRLPIIGGSVDGRPLDEAELRKVATMPTLDALRAQIVGLLSTPASKIVGTIGATGRTVSRTLQGYHAGLATPETDSSAPPPPS